MNNQNDLQDDLHDGLDPKLQKLYRQLPKEQPSPELDAKILAAAKITPPNQNQSQKKSHRWQAPFALAASVVMVSSVVLYIHEENPAAFDASVPTTPAAHSPTAEMAKPATNHISEPAPAEDMAKTDLKDATTVNDIDHAKSLADQKLASQKAKDAPIAQSQTAQTASADDFNDHRLTALAEKKADMANRANQKAKIIAANKSVQSALIAKEQETRQAKTETDQFTAAAPAPAPMFAPAPQMQPQPEVGESKSWQAGRLQDSNRTSRQLSAAMSESDKPSALALAESNPAPTLAAAPMASAPMNAGSLAGAAMPMAKQVIKSDEATRADNVQNMSAPVLSIEGVAMGMNREQLVTQGLTCYVDVCHLDLSQPQQKTYWGIPAQNAHLTAFLSRQVVTKLMLQQKNVQIDQVKTALSNVGIVSQQSCREEKGTLLMSRLLGTNVFNLRSMGTGLSLAICQR